MQSPLLVLAGVALIYLGALFMAVSLPLGTVLFIMALVAFAWAALELVAILTPTKKQADE